MKPTLKDRFLLQSSAYRCWHALLLVLACTCLPSCTESTISGTWKPVAVEWEGGTTVDVTNADFRDDLFRKQLAFTSMQRDSQPVDSFQVRKEVDSTMALMNASRLYLNRDSTFLMKSNGFILPSAMPGWHFGNELEGRWRTSGNRIRLVLGEEEANIFSLEYVIEKQVADTLLLRGVFGWDQPLNRITFIRQ